MLAAQARSEALAMAGSRARPVRRVRYRTRFRLYPSARIALGGLVVCLALLAYVAERTAIVDLNYRLGERKSALSTALVDNERLKLEASQLSSLERIEKVATTALGMVRPGQTRYVAVAAPGAEDSLAQAANGQREENDLISRVKSVWSAFARAAAPGESWRR